VERLSGADLHVRHRGGDLRGHCLFGTEMMTKNMFFFLQFFGPYKYKFVDSYLEHFSAFCYYCQSAQFTYQLFSSLLGRVKSMQLPVLLETEPSVFSDRLNWQIYYETILQTVGIGV
jgi:hypothetical protein